VHWFDGEQPLAVQDSVNLWVDYPARIGQASKVAANHPAVERIAAIDKEALDCKQRLKAKRPRK
jgi:hypothetical protein